MQFVYAANKMVSEKNNKKEQNKKKRERNLFKLSNQSFQEKKIERAFI